MGTVEIGSLVLSLLSGVAPALAQIAPGAERVVVETQPGWAYWVNIIGTIANIVIAIALIIIALALIGIVLQLRKAYRRATAVVKRLPTDLAPVLKNVEQVSENVGHMSGAVRRNVEEVSQTVSAGAERVQESAAAAERRVRGFGAFLQVVQEQAEGAFIRTAAGVHGVRVGAATYLGLRGADRGQEDGDPYESVPQPEGTTLRIEPRKGEEPINEQ